MQYFCLSIVSVSLAWVFFLNVLLLPEYHVCIYYILPFVFFYFSVFISCWPEYFVCMLFLPAYWVYISFAWVFCLYAVLFLYLLLFCMSILWFFTEYFVRIFYVCIYFLFAWFILFASIIFIYFCARKRSCLFVVIRRQHCGALWNILTFLLTSNHACLTKLTYTRHKRPQKHVFNRVLTKSFYLLD